jgi:hypothetical protein
MSKTYLPKPKDWPDALYRLCTTDAKTRRAKYSVTELIQPPQMLALKRRHEHEMVIDPADMLWRLFGKLLHGKLEAVAGSESLSEEGMVLEVAGVTISGQPDLYEAETVWDYKVTSTYAVKEGVKPEWEQQLNIYAHLFRAHGFPVKRLRIVAILRDWSATKAKREDDYPKRQVVVMPVELWDGAKCSEFILECVDTHELAAKHNDDMLSDLCPCSDADRWAKPEKFAVMKRGAKKAVKLHDTSEAAQAHAEQLGAGHTVEHRPGELVRCAEYCEAAPWCKQGGKGLTVNEAIERAGL